MTWSTKNSSAEAKQDTAVIEIWHEGKRIGVIEDVQWSSDPDCYDETVDPIVDNWVSTELHTRVLSGRGLTFDEAISLYDKGCKEFPELLQRGKPREQFCELLDGTWFLSPSDDLLGVVTPAEVLFVRV